MAKIPEAEKRAKSESDSDEEESDGSSSEEGSSESGSESESEQKQPAVAKKPSSLPPAAAKKTKSLVQKPSEKSESESESGSESDSDESEAEVEQVAPKPAADPPKSKSVAKKPNPPKPAAASTVTPPTKSTAKKRAAEDKQSAAKGSKKPKADPENSEANSKDETKKQLFHRLWNEDDEIALLKGLADYKQKKKADPYAELDSFHLFIGENLHVEVTKAQLQDKIRRLKKKYETNKTKDQPNKDKSFSKPHEKKIYELSEPVWGNVEKAVEKSASVKKTRGKSVNVVENGESDDAKNEENVVENGESDDVENEKSVDVVSGDVEKGAATTGSDYSSVQNRISRMGAEMYEGADDGTELQKRWRKLREKEMEIHMMKLELMRDQTKLVLDGKKSRNL
ncbi:hypothetical protein ABFS82_08G147900 [Erythranthe guttata]|uniref:Glabrous enhancer-binding protein-like DBD domain-containing protein n=1 Tax=Erythranthe guttata TaxID=4155 RepID=A0A022R526_ERYGU|nr:PREDICTED: mediator-associated protein 1-like [Erythranthe guttata]EYU33920.1 hypothetical protein MIMGU_mgv1a007745mg [Erythranthe guttata]|eukprot:XP_012842004.1 PREDICTED: mediator-associated protein 1-like [Erythranthe guttata]